jgi:hypothetical protein
MLPARLRVGVRWSDACILNISSRGLMISAGNAFVEGSTVEVRRGAHAILARVMWREGPKAGLWADEPLPVEDIVTMAQSATLEVTAADSLTMERRRRKRAIYDDSRQRARALQFAFSVVVAVGLSAAILSMVQHAFGKPIAIVGSVLGG